MRREEFKKPTLIALYGFPGSGKSYVSANLSKVLPIAHINTDRIRGEFFKKSTGSPTEEIVAEKIALYMANEFLRAGTSVVFDTNSLDTRQRRRLREIATRHKAGYLLIWLQIDKESAFSRALSRDRRMLENKYAPEQSQAVFIDHISKMQDPKNEDYLVLSGKHAFSSQRSAIFNRLYQMSLVDSTVLSENVTRPGLINLIPPMPSPVSKQLPAQDDDA